jgi:hypothetical protein
MPNDQSVPLWWHSMFPNGECDGHLRTFETHTERFIQRNTDCLVINFETDKNTKIEQETREQVEHLCLHNRWSHLTYQIKSNEAAAKALKTALTALGKGDLLSPYARVVLLGVGSAVHHAMAPTGAFTSTPRVIVCGTQTELEIPTGISASVFYDPLSANVKLASKSKSKTTLLRMPLLGQDMLGTLYRASLLDETLGAAIRGELTQTDFHKIIRARKTLPEYQTAITKHLRKRGGTGAIRTQVWPKAMGNVWMLEERPNELRYMSDQWNGRTIGFQERDGITLAQTPPTLLCAISIGDHTGIPRALSERYPWHVVDENLNGHAADFGARAHGALLAAKRDRTNNALPGVIAIDVPQPASVPSDMQPHSPLRITLESKLSQAVISAVRQGKELSVDRVSFGFFAGASDLSAEDAREFYIDFIRWLQDLIPTITGQTLSPVFVMTQASGGRACPDAQAILAEGRLEAELPVTDLVVAGPAYPYALMAGMPNTPDLSDRLLMDELETTAVDAAQRGERWHCPTLQLATVKGRTITATFTTMSQLILGPEVHGFKLMNCEAEAHITSVTVIDHKTVQIECSVPPCGDDVHLCYAWGPSEGDGHQKLQNCGALRDSWEADSHAVPDAKLYRYALAGAARLLREYQPK